MEEEQILEEDKKYGFYAWETTGYPVHTVVYEQNYHLIFEAANCGVKLCGIDANSDIWFDKNYLTLRNNFKSQEFYSKSFMTLFDEIYKLRNK